jgi:DNA-directed RNA polymerase alpha subunit
VERRQDSGNLSLIHGVLLAVRNEQMGEVKPHDTARRERSISELSLSTRTYNALRSGGFKTIGQVMDAAAGGGRALKRTHGLGAAGVKEVLLRLSPRDLKG